MHVLYWRVPNKLKPWYEIPFAIHPLVNLLAHWESVTSNARKSDNDNRPTICTPWKGGKDTSHRQRDVISHRSLSMGNTTFIQLIHRNRVVTPTCNPKATFWEFGQWLTQGHQQNSAHCGWGSDWGFGDLSIIFSMIDHFPACHWLSCFSRKTPRILPGHLVFSQGPAEDERSTERSWLISKQQELVILLMEGLPHQLIYGEYHRISHFSWASIDNRWFSRLISEASSDLFLMDYYRNPWGLSRSSGCPLIRLRFGCTWVRKLKMWQCSQKTWLLYPVETLGNTTHPTRKCCEKKEKRASHWKYQIYFLNIRDSSDETTSLKIWHFAFNVSRLSVEPFCSTPLPYPFQWLKLYGFWSWAL